MLELWSNYEASYTSRVEATSWAQPQHPDGLKVTPVTAIFKAKRSDTFFMAKKRARRSFNLRPVRVNSGMSIGALASADVISAAIVNNATNNMRVVSAHLSFTWADIQAVIDDAMAFGIAHGDYTSAEIEECLEAAGGMDKGDKIALEQSNRLVREVGQISGLKAAPIGSGAEFNDGRLIKIKLNWNLSIGEALQVWVRNNSGVVYTTGSTLSTSGKLWVRD